MNALVRFGHAVYFLALTMWVAALVTAGIAAMNTFTRLPRMQVQLREFTALPADEHGRLAAGMVMEGVFTTVDWMQIIAVPLTVLTLILLLAVTRPSWRSIPNLMRFVCIIAAAGLFAFHIFVLAPTMNRHLHGYWDEIKAGRVTEARAQLEAFDQLHPTASGLLKVNLLLLVVGIFASAMITAHGGPLEKNATSAPDASP